MTKTPKASFIAGSMTDLPVILCELQPDLLPFKRCFAPVGPCRMQHVRSNLELCPV